LQNAEFSGLMLPQLVQLFCSLNPHLLQNLTLRIIIVAAFIANSIYNITIR